MKFTNRPQRRRATRTGQNISMFPFLAVLICTMGALVPLLMVITRTVRLQAEAAAMAKHDEAKRTRREDARWRIEQLTHSRDQTAAQLAEARLELGHIEDHARRLHAQLIQHEQAAKKLDKLETTDQQQVAATKAELEQLRRQIAAAQHDVAEAHQAAAERNRSYAIVPYEGPNQTHRRPIYVECRADSIVLQPEGIVFTEADFEGPLGPGNPLAAGLRAAREYLLAQREFNPQVGEPYPMLLVRPEGIGAFYVARVAMQSWGSDFGYELVDADWKLAYQTPDHQLAEAVRQSVASARAYQQRLIASAPREYGRPKTVYRASSSGGFVPEGGGIDPRRQDSRDRGRGFGNTAGSDNTSSSNNPYVTSPERNTNSVAGGTPGTGSLARRTAAGNYYGANQSGGGTGPSNQANNPSSTIPKRPTTAVVGGTQEPGLRGTGSDTRTGTGGQAYNPYITSPQNTSNSMAGGYPNTGSTGTGSGSGTGSDNQANTPYITSPQNSTYSNAGGNPNSGFTGSGAPGGGGSGTPGQANNPCNSSAQNSSLALTVGNPGTESQRSEGYVVGQPPREQDSSQSGQNGTGHPLRPGEWQPRPNSSRNSQPPPDDKHDQKPSTPQALAATRGHDWGLRETNHGSVGLTRPMQIHCYADRLIVISDRGPHDNRTVPLGPRTASAVDPLISAVWDQMDAWGMAGRGMYWKPVLQMHVAPNAERRFVELSALLEGSGLTITRR